MKKETSKNQGVLPEATGVELHSSEQQNTSSPKKNLRQELPHLTNRLLGELDECSPLNIGDKVEEIAKIVKINRSCEWVLIGACTFSLISGNRQTGGRGRLDLEETGCLSTYKSSGDTFDLHWKTVAEYCSLYDRFFIATLPADADLKTIRLKRTKFIEQAISLGKTFYSIAFKSTNPLEAIKHALIQVAKKSKYTIKQFEIDLIKLGWLPVPSSGNSELQDQPGNSGADSIGIKYNLEYHIVELIAELAEQQRLSQEAVISAAVRLYSENLNSKGGKSDEKEGIL